MEIFSEAWLFFSLQYILLTVQNSLNILTRERFAECGSWFSNGGTSDQQVHTFVPSPNGTLMAAVVPGDPVSLLASVDLSLTESLKLSNEAGQPICAAFGPTGSVLVVGSGVNGVRAKLEFWVIGDNSQGCSWAASNADAILWGFLARRQVWDTIQRIQFADALDGSSAEQAAMLETLDDVIHSQPYHPRPAYAKMQDHVKARILASSSDKIAKVIKFSWIPAHSYFHLE